MVTEALIIAAIVVEAWPQPATRSTIMNRTPIVVVVGSLNMDRTFRVPRIPAPGETLTASGAFSCFGGKGANQAVAAARAGAQVRMVGCVGDDDDAERYRIRLAGEGIETAAICTAAGLPTGSAFITVDDAGENAIVVHPGANHALTPGMVEEAAFSFEHADVVLLQLECPLPAVRWAAELARAAGATVILNPSPWDAALRSAGVPVDVCIVNAREARALTGCNPEGLTPASAEAAGCATLVVTRGADPTLVISSAGDVIEVAPPPVTPVDTVGAGDTFAGAFAVARAECRSLGEAVGFANRAAALSTQRPGAQDAIPTRDMILA